MSYLAPVVKPKILVVDNDPAVANLCSRALAGDSYRVETVSSAEEALAVLKDRFFNMVISDIKLPGRMDGIGLLKEIKYRYPSIIVIIMTAYATIETAINAMNIGACNFLIKPFDILVLSNTVCRSLELCRLRSETTVFENALPLFEFLLDISSDKTENELLLSLLKNALKIAKANSGSVFVYDKTTEKLTMTASIGLPGNIKREVKIGEGIVGYVAKNRKPMILHDGLQNHPQFNGMPTRKEIVSSIVNPILLKGRIVGVLCLNKTGDSPVLFLEEDKRIVDMFSNYAAVVIGSFQISTELLQLDRIKSEFLSNVSHELRTPLMSISGATELLGDEGIDNKRQMLELIHRNVRRLNTLVASLLDFSKMESGELIYNFRKSNISNLLDKVAADFENEFRNKKIKFCSNIEKRLPPVLIDSERMYQAVSNLLSNALKFTPEGGRVELRCARNRKCLAISVRDTGIGISKEYHNKIYSKFFQVNGSSMRKVMGFGLGLAIVNSIVSAHKGKIKVKSELKKGSRFVIYLPCSPAVSRK